MPKRKQQRKKLQKKPYFGLDRVPPGHKPGGMKDSLVAGQVKRYGEYRINPNMLNKFHPRINAHMRQIDEEIKKHKPKTIEEARDIIKKVSPKTITAPHPTHTFMQQRVDLIDELFKDDALFLFEDEILQESPVIEETDDIVIVKPSLRDLKNEKEDYDDIDLTDYVYDDLFEESYDESYEDELEDIDLDELSEIDFVEETLKYMPDLDFDYDFNDPVPEIEMDDLFFQNINEIIKDRPRKDRFEFVADILADDELDLIFDTEENKDNFYKDVKKCLDNIPHEIYTEASIFVCMANVLASTKYNFSVFSNE